MGQISGKIIKMLPVVTGQGKNGEWVKQEFIIETQDQYPKKICCTTWGAVASNMDSYKVGDKVTVHYNLESREYNEKWFTEAKAWKVVNDGVKSTEAKPQIKEQSKSLSDTSELAEDSENLPF